MPKPNFKPPVETIEIFSFGKLAEGELVSATVLLRDANNALFSLHVQSPAMPRNEELAEDNIVHGATNEPIFMVPEDVITFETIEQVLSDVSPELLQKYLVLQDDFEV